MHAMAPPCPLICPADEIEERLRLAHSIVNKLRSFPYGREGLDQGLPDFHLNTMQLAAMLATDMQRLQVVEFASLQQFSCRGVEALIAACMSTHVSPGAGPILTLGIASKSCTGNRIASLATRMKPPRLNRRRIPGKRRL